MSRADRPASSRMVAQVFRNTCDVTQAKPAVARAVRRSREVLLGSRHPPTESGKSGSYGPVPGRRRCSISTGSGGRGSVRSLFAVVLDPGHAPQTLAGDADQLPV